MPGNYDNGGLRTGRDVPEDDILGDGRHIPESGN